MCVAKTRGARGTAVIFRAPTPRERTRAFTRFSATAVTRTAPMLGCCFLYRVRIETEKKNEKNEKKKNVNKRVTLQHAVSFERLTATAITFRTIHGKVRFPSDSGTYGNRCVQKCVFLARDKRIFLYTRVHVRFSRAHPHTSWASKNYYSYVR